MHSSVFVAALAALAAVAVSAQAAKEDTFGETDQDSLYGTVSRTVRARARGGGAASEAGSTRIGTSSRSETSDASYGRVHKSPSSKARGLGLAPQEKPRTKEWPVGSPLMTMSRSTRPLDATRRLRIHASKLAGVEECRYKKEPWSECDNATNTQKRKLVLKRGSGTCDPTKELTRRCKKACRYEKGTWNACDAATNTRRRTDKLKPKSDQSCEATRTITKKCKNTSAGCRYNRNTQWSECDTKTNTRNKVMRLMSGNPSECEASKTITKPCRATGRGGGRKSEEDTDEE
ncbi:uncharacterized protein LOC135401769 isoform X2 [Ornithodoros turicata]